MMLNDATRMEVERLMAERTRLDQQIQDLTTTPLPEVVEVVFYGFPGVLWESRKTRDKLPVEVGSTPARMVLIGVRQDDAELQIKPWRVPKRVLLTHWEAWTIKDGARSIRIGGDKLRLSMDVGDRVTFDRSWDPS